MPVSVLNLCEFNFKRYPQRTASSYHAQSFSYQELHQRCNQLAYYLKLQGIKRSMIFAILSKNYLERIICIISLWKLGAAYLPIDPNYSPRNNFVQHGSKIEFLITQGEIFKKNSVYDARIICTNAKNNLLNKLTSDDLTERHRLSDIAYIAYTSGSTGNPKGVIITQANIGKLYNSWEIIYKLSYTDRHFQTANFGFVCRRDIIKVIGSGAHLDICPTEILLKTKHIYELLPKQKINLAEFTPTLLRKLVNYLEQHDLNLHFMPLLIYGSDSWYVKEYWKFCSFLNLKACLTNS